MAKSIRSKSRRKSRSEFRKTIGTVAYNESMTKIQQKLKESLEKQSMTCIDRLAKALGTSTSAFGDDANNMELDNNASSKNAIDACDSMTPQIAILAEEQQQADEKEQDPQLFKGENKAVIRGKKRRQSKYDLASAQKKKHQQANTSSTSKPKPRYFCKF